MEGGSQVHTPDNQVRSDSSGICERCHCPVSSPRNLLRHYTTCLLQDSNRPPDLRLPPVEESTRLHGILTSANTIHQSIVILQLTRTCCPGIYPMFFAPSSRNRAPILDHIGAVGKEAYGNIRRAVHDGAVRLPKRLAIEIGRQPHILIY